MPFVLGPMQNMKAKRGSAVPTGIDDPVGERRNKDNKKCNGYIRDINKMLWGKGRFFLSVVISGR